jgi:hypothetical protein
MLRIPSELCWRRRCIKWIGCSLVGMGRRILDQTVSGHRPTMIWQTPGFRMQFNASTSMHSCNSSAYDQWCRHRIVVERKKCPKSTRPPTFYPEYDCSCKGAVEMFGAMGVTRRYLIHTYLTPPTSPMTKRRDVGVNEYDRLGRLCWSGPIGPKPIYDPRLYNAT